MRNSLAWILVAALAAVLAVVLATPALRPATAPPRPAAVAYRAAEPAALVPAPPGSIRAVVEQTKPAVVQITSKQVTLDLLGRPTTAGSGIGSGVIYDPRGLILTNNHVVEGARALTVALPDGRTYPGKLLGGDPLMDLAVVQIAPQAGESLPVAVLGDSEALGVGDWVVAIGNALGLPGGPTVTAGVVSAVGRAVQEPGQTSGEPGPYLYDLIQTDAAINPGNSGGPLLNVAGEVVGINTIVAGSAGNVMAQGIGFAIAINAAQPIAAQLAAGGRVSHPFLGVAYVPVTPGIAAQLGVSVKQGVVVSQVVAGSPAARAGLQTRDVIAAVDGQPIVDETTLGRELNRRKPGERVQLSIVRGSERVPLDVALGERPSR